MAEGIAVEIGRTITNIGIKAVYADMLLEDLGQDPKGTTRTEIELWKSQTRVARKALVNMYDKLMDLGVAIGPSWKEET